MTGGEINWGNGQGTGVQSNPEAVRFAFYVGAEVETYHLFYTERGRIIARQVEYLPPCPGPGIGPGPKSGYFPTYKVQYLKNGSVHWFLQSEISY